MINKNNVFFKTIFEDMIQDEGGYVFHKNKGESDYTFAGIYRKWHPNWKGWFYVDKKDFKNKSLLKEVENFYKKNFWNKLKLHLLNSFPKSNLIFDFAVNAGKRKSVKLTQKVINFLLNVSTDTIKEDGIIGLNTINYLKKIKDAEFSLCFTNLKVQYYAKLALKNDKYKRFYNGWINRANPELQESIYFIQQNKGD